MSQDPGPTLSGIASEAARWVACLNRHTAEARRGRASGGDQTALGGVLDRLPFHCEPSQGARTCKKQIDTVVTFGSSAA